MALACAPSRVQADDAADAAALTARLRGLTAAVETTRHDLRDIQLAAADRQPTVPDSGPSALTQFDMRLSALEEALRQLTGQVEEVNFNLSQLRERVERMSTDTDFRLTQLEKAAQNNAGAAAPAAVPADEGKAPPDKAPPANPGSNAAGTTGLAPGPQTLGSVGGKPAINGKPIPTAKTPPPEAAPVLTPLPPGSPKEQYDYAFDLLIRAQYAQAEGALRSFISAYPNDALTPNAQYWLGESFFARQNYKDAAEQFLIGYQKYPQSLKAPDNLLKLGLSLQNLSKKPEACSAYSRFTKEYPTASITLKRRVAEEQQRLNCPKS
jgi:tol-pal system protein YbgF